MYSALTNQSNSMILIFIVHPILYTTIFFLLVVIFNSVLIISNGFLTEQKPEITF